MKGDSLKKPMYLKMTHMLKNTFSVEEALTRRRVHILLSLGVPLPPPLPGLVLPMYDFEISPSSLPSFCLSFLEDGVIVDRRIPSLILQG